MNYNFFDPTLMGQQQGGMWTTPPQQPQMSWLEMLQQMLPQQGPPSMGAFQPPDPMANQGPMAPADFTADPNYSPMADFKAIGEFGLGMVPFVESYQTLMNDPNALYDPDKVGQLGAGALMDALEVAPFNAGASLMRKAVEGADFGVELGAGGAGFMKTAKPRDVFYSAVDRAVENMKQPRASGAQWLAMIQNTPGVKPGEIEARGLQQLAQMGPMTKEELQSFLAQPNRDLLSQMEFDSRFEVQPHQQNVFTNDVVSGDGRTYQGEPVDVEGGRWWTNEADLHLELDRLAEERAQAWYEDAEMVDERRRAWERENGPESSAWYDAYDRASQENDDYHYPQWTNKLDEAVDEYNDEVIAPQQAAWDEQYGGREEGQMQLPGMEGDTPPRPEFLSGSEEVIDGQSPDFEEWLESRNEAQRYSYDKLDTDFRNWMEQTGNNEFEWDEPEFEDTDWDDLDHWQRGEYISAEREGMDPDDEYYPRLVEGDLDPVDGEAPGAAFVRQPEYGSYTTPGGEAYREDFIRMPGGFDQHAETAMTPDAFTVDPEPVSISGNTPIWRVRGPDGTEMNILAFDQGEARRVARDMWNDHVENRRDFDGGHWGGSPHSKNVVAHQRLKDRMIDGKLTLDIEENQSDLAKRGRKSGFSQRGGFKVSDFDIEPLAKNDDGTPMGDDWVVRLKRDPKRGEDITAKSKEEAAIKAVAFWNSLHGGKTGNAPNTPWKGTNDWAKLNMKKAVAEAIEGGYEQISWTTGTTQNKRYSLAEYADRVDFDPERNKIIVYRNATDNAPMRTIEIEEGKDLADYVGDDVAKRLMSDDARPKFKPKYVVRTWDPQSQTYKKSEPLDELPEDFAFESEVQPGSNQVTGYAKVISGKDDDMGVLVLNRDEAKSVFDRIANENSGKPHSLTGNQLEIGGSGMKGAYDEMLVKEVAKEFKVKPKRVPMGLDLGVHGPGGAISNAVNRYIQEGAIPRAPENWDEIASFIEANPQAFGSGRREILDWVAKQNSAGKKINYLERWVLPITEDMKKKYRANKGMPLFSIAPPAALIGGGLFGGQQTGQHNDTRPVEPWSAYKT